MAGNVAVIQQAASLRYWLILRCDRPPCRMASNLGSSIFKATLGLVLILMGAGGTFVLWRAWQRAEETRSWKPAEAVIISSQVLTDRPTPHSPPEYTAEVHYRYTIAG